MKIEQFWSGRYAARLAEYEFGKEHFIPRAQQCRDVWFNWFWFNFVRLNNGAP